MNPSPLLTPRFVAQALDLPLTGENPDLPFTSITTDSRKIQPGYLFVAIPGEQFDGHDFLDAAIKNGARGVIARKDRVAQLSIPQNSPAPWIFGVHESIEAYRKLAHSWRKCFSIPVVAVAGSVGKTSTKEILAALCSGKWPEVLKTQGSQNGFVGIPMTLLELSPKHGVAVVEIGIDEKGAMEKHLQLVAPTLAVLTAIGPEHLEKLIDLPTVAREESIALLATAAQGGTVVVNLDDPWIAPLWEQFTTGHRIGFTLAKSQERSTLRGTILQEKEGEEEPIALIEVDGEGILRERFALPLPGIHNARNFLAALTLARSMGLTPGEIRKGLENFRGAEGRSEVRSLPGGGLAVCDYYNAQPASMEAGLELLSMKAKGRTRFACLGDMLEMGTQEEKLHRDLAPLLTRLGVENVFLYGPRMKWLAEELKKSSFGGFFSHFNTHQELHKELHSRMKVGDALLIKGSRGMKMEEIWKLIKSSQNNI